MAESIARMEGAATARRALQLLELICDSAVPMTLDSLVGNARLSKSTAYRLVRVLVEEQFIERSETGGYRPGVRFIRLSARAVPEFEFHRAAEPILRELADAAGETATLHRRLGLRSSLVLGAEAAGALHRAVTIGETTHLHRGCSGLSLLAALRESDLQSLLKAAEDAGEDVEEIDDVLSEIRQRGYAMSFGANHPGLNGIATAVLAGDRSPLYCVAISGPADRWTRIQMVDFAPRLMASAKELAAALAHPSS